MSTPVTTIPSSLAMARSPLFITGRNNAQPNDTLINMSLFLRIYSGVRTGTGTNNYSLSKNYSINQVINFEVSDLVRSEFYHDFSVWDDLGYTQSPQGEALWVYPFGDFTYSDNGAAPDSGDWGASNQQTLVTDGWATMTNISPSAVSQPVLATSRNRQVLPSNYESLALYNSIANEIQYIEIEWSNGNSGDLTSGSPLNLNPPDPSSLNSQNLVIYAGVGPQNLQNNPYIADLIKPSQNTDAEYYDVKIYNLSDQIIQTVRYYTICEPKYTPYQIAFINRFGVADFITFFKRSDERGNFTQESYQKSIYNDGFTTPSLQVGKYQSYNVNSRNSLTLNTGFVEQDYDETIKDILMSEYVAVLDGSNWVSVVPQRGSVEYQKHINQKVINYTLTFDYGFDERSLVR